MRYCMVIKLYIYAIILLITVLLNNCIVVFMYC